MLLSRDLNAIWVDREVSVILLPLLIANFLTCQVFVLALVCCDLVGFLMSRCCYLVVQISIAQLDDMVTKGLYIQRVMGNQHHGYL